MQFIYSGLKPKCTSVHGVCRTALVCAALISKGLPCTSLACTTLVSSESPCVVTIMPCSELNCSEVVLEALVTQAWPCAACLAVVWIFKCCKEYFTSAFTLIQEQSLNSHFKLISVMTGGSW